MSNRTPTPSIFIAPRSTLECIIHSTQCLSSTPFASSAMSDRFEYPFPIIQPLPMTAVSPPSPISSSTQALSNGSIVPPNGTGRGVDMSSLASFALGSPHATPAALSNRYPPASASASQSPDQTPPVYASFAVDICSHPYYSAAQQCTLASANAPVPPSLVFKRRGQKLNVVRRQSSSSTDDSNSTISSNPTDLGPRTGMDGVYKL